MKGRIKVGALVSQDFRNYYWPIGDADPDTVFYMQWCDTFFYCVAPGFGWRRDYGNGAIYVHRGPQHQALYLHLRSNERKP